MTADIQGAVSAVPQVSWLEGQLRQEVAARKRLVEAAIQLTSTFDSDKLLQLIMSSATELLDAETSSLMLVDEDTTVDDAEHERLMAKAKAQDVHSTLNAGNTP